MKRYLSFMLVIGLSLFQALQVNAEKPDSVQVKKSGLVVGLKYLSNNVYLGRLDSANIMYLVPSIGYYHKSGLHVEASLSYQFDAGINRIDAFTLEGGYDFSIGDNFSGGLSAEKSFYDLNSMALNSVNDFGISSNFSYDFSIVTLNAGAGLAFNDKTDVITEAGLNRSFEIGKLTIEPALKLNAGTQNYYNSYLLAGKSHLNGNKGHGKANGSAKGKSANKGASTTTATTSDIYSILEASKYKILDYEISVPFSYNFHNFKFDVIPTYAIPVNPATILSSTGTVEKEAISNHFVLQLGITYKFN
ncbi:MAG: hypothetical protein Q8904_02905 [Bacteroidota bacterium]|nr:hypothetical protein [Bacteroidota bacterium]